MSVITFENEGPVFRDYMESHPNAVVVLRKADGSCDVDDDPTGQHDIIDGEVVE